MKNRIGNALHTYLLFLATSVLPDVIAALNVDVEDNGVNVKVGACLTVESGVDIISPQQLHRWVLCRGDMDIGRAIVFQN